MSEPLVTKMGADLCPHCKTLLNISKSNEGRVPMPGSATICYKCGGFCKYGEDMALEKLSHADLSALPTAAQRELTRVRGLILKRNYDERNAKRSTNS